MSKVVGNTVWAAYVKDKRKMRRMTRRRMAEYANIDPSYVTLIERDGYVPRRDKVCKIARALNLDEEETLLAAGFSNSRVAAVYRDSASELKLAKPLLTLVKRLGKMDSNKQMSVAKGLSGLLEAVNG